MSKSFYAVRQGYKVGIYDNWTQCHAQVNGYKGAIYKKFKTYQQAEAFLRGEEEPLLEELMVAEDLEEGEAIAYVDGSFSQEKNNYSFGLVYITKDKLEEFNGTGDNQEMAKMRNVAGELKGAMEAMKLAKDRGMKRLYLHYDYSGIEGWAELNWERNLKGTEAYKRFYDSIKKDLEVVFVKVKGHSQIKYNDQADRLAKEALL